MSEVQKTEIRVESARFQRLGLKPGRFDVGAWVRLRSPEESRASFESPEAPLLVVEANWFRTHDGPTYTLAERGCSLGVTPFRDDDLVLCEEIPHAPVQEP
jgi:hypothetical protein